MPYDMPTEEDRRLADENAHEVCSVCNVEGDTGGHCASHEPLTEWGGLYFHVPCLAFAQEETKVLELASVVMNAGAK